jgi:hypothetical protein
MLAQNQLAIEEDLMWLASGYFDESIDDEVEDRCFSLAGWICPPVTALHIDMRWRDILNKWNLDYFKASQITYGFGQFAQFRDNPKDLKAPLSRREKGIIAEIFTDFVNVICSDDEFWGIGATVVMRDWYLFREQEPELAKRLPNIYTLCANLLMMEAGQTIALTNEHIRARSHYGLIRPIFDIQEEYGPRLKQAFPLFRELNPRSAEFMLEPIFEREQDYVCLQAADLFAYECRKMLINAVYDPQRPERKAFARLKEQITVIYFLNYESLETIARAQKRDHIAINAAIRNRDRQIKLH